MSHLHVRILIEEKRSCRSYNLRAWVHGQAEGDYGIATDCLAPYVQVAKASTVTAARRGPAELSS